MAVEFGLSYPMGKSAQGAVDLLRPGVVDAHGMTTGAVVLQSDAGTAFLRKNHVAILPLLDIVMYL